MWKEITGRVEQNRALRWVEVVDMDALTSRSGLAVLSVDSVIH